MSNNKLVIVNFNFPLSDALKLEMKAILGREVDEQHYHVGINMNKNIYIQCVDIIDRIPNIKSLPIDFIVNLPGLPIASVYLLNELEARAGFKPQVLELQRTKDEDGKFTDFHFGKVRSLQYELDRSKEKANRK